MNVTFPDGDKLKSFLIDPLGTKMLESMTRLDISLAVPYVKMWAIDDNGKPLFPSATNADKPHSPLTVGAISPPKFGQGATDIFPERPDFSIESISIDSSPTPGVGTIICEQTKIQFVVHNIDSYNKKSDVDTWESLIALGQRHAIEIGWKGAGANGLFNGQGVAGQYAEIHSIRRFHFVVSFYEINVRQDGQMSITMTAVGNEQYSLGQQPLFKTPRSYNDKKQKVKGKPSAPKKLETISKEEQSRREAANVAVQKIKNAVEENCKNGLRFKDLIKSTLEAADSGQIVGDVEIIFGNFSGQTAEYGERRHLGKGKQKKSSATSEKEGEKSEEKKQKSTFKVLGAPANQSIGDFIFTPAQYEKVMKKFVSGGARASAGNFIKSLVDAASNADWNTKEGKVRPVLYASVSGSGKGGKEKIVVKIADARNKPSISEKLLDEYHGIKRDPETHDIQETGSEGKLSRSEMRKKVAAAGVPYVSIYGGSAYISESNFSFQQSGTERAILLERQKNKTGMIGNIENKVGPAGNWTAAEQMKQIGDSNAILFSSLISGDISMIGNFVFDSCSSIWLEMPHRVWSGSYFITGVRHEISAGKFTTSVSVKSAQTAPSFTKVTVKSNQGKAGEKQKKPTRKKAPDKK